MFRKFLQVTLLITLSMAFLYCLSCKTSNRATILPGTERQALTISWQDFTHFEIEEEEITCKSLDNSFIRKVNPYFYEDIPCCYQPVITPHAYGRTFPPYSEPFPQCDPRHPQAEFTSGEPDAHTGQDFINMWVVTGQGLKMFCRCCDEYCAKN